LNVSEQASDQTNGDLKGETTETGSDASNVTAGSSDQPVLASSSTDAAKVKPEQENMQTSKADTKRSSGTVVIMAPSRDRSWDSDTIDHGSASADGSHASGLFGKRRLSALAAIVALATVTGAIGGALATAGFGHFITGEEPQATANRTHALENSLTRIESDIAALKTNIERSTKGDTTQFAKVNDRIDKLEKAQAEPTAKLAKISETLEKLRVAAASTPAPSPAPVTTTAPAQVAAKDTTGSISNAAVPLPAPKPEIARLPTVEGWVLRDVANGAALIEGRQGIYEVYAGDPVPGVGRVDAIRKQDGHWVVVTSRGLIVAR
jgi:hypothetical protein